MHSARVLKTFGLHSVLVAPAVAPAVAPVAPAEAPAGMELAQIEEWKPIPEEVAVELVLVAEYSLSADWKDWAGADRERAADLAVLDILAVLLDYIERAADLAVLDVPAVLEYIERAAAAAGCGMLVADTAVVDIAAVAAAGIAAAAVGSANSAGCGAVAGADNGAAVGILVVGFDLGARPDTVHVRSRSSHLAYLHAAATENERSKNRSGIGTDGTENPDTYPSLSNKLLNFGLAATFEFHVFFVRELRLSVHRFPARILLEFFAFRLCQKFFQTNHAIAIGINFTHDMLPHAFHFLFALTHIVLGMTRLIHFVQITLENRLQFDFVQLSVVVQIFARKKVICNQFGSRMRATHLTA